MRTLSEYSKTDAIPSGEGMVIAVVQADFNPHITRKMVEYCLQLLQESRAVVHHHQVAGALEIPVVLQWCHRAYQPQAMIALGCVIRGETYHFEIVAQQSAQALIQLSHTLSTGIANGILTCNSEAQAKERQLSVARHCAKAALELAHLKAQLCSEQR